MEGMEVRPRRAREAFWRWEQVFAMVRMEGMVGGLGVAARPLREHGSAEVEKKVSWRGGDSLWKRGGGVLLNQDS